MSEQQFELWLEFEIWEPQPNDDPENDFCNIQIRLPDGRVYACNVWTFNFLSSVRQRSRETGESLGGTYSVAPDLFVERLERSLIERVVTDLIRTNSLRAEWLIPEDTPDDDAEAAEAWEDPIFAALVEELEKTGRLKHDDTCDS